MKVLVLAPHPFYQERGTPIAVDLLVRALGERGDEVHLLTFHEGEDRHYPFLELQRIRPFPHVSNVPPGFSLRKLLCDGYLFWRFLSMMRANHYDVVHAVEESAFMAMVVCAWRKCPFVYDMDSCLSAQITGKFPLLRPLTGMLEYLESLPIRRARAVVPMCDALAERARRYRTQGIVVLKDISLLSQDLDGEQIPDLRQELGIDGQVIMYIGNLEHYQGIDLLLEAFSRYRHAGGSAHLVVIGGSSGHIADYQRKSKQLGIGACTHFLGPRPVRHMAGYLSQADILVSPRTQGENTPMKIYSYLHSGRAVLATRLPTHTQVMNDEMAMLADPDPASFAAAMEKLLQDESLRMELAARARSYIEAEHSYEAFRARVHALYADLEQERTERGGAGTPQ